jgi:hypothetical protein
MSKPENYDVLEFDKLFGIKPFELLDEKNGEEFASFVNKITTLVTVP